MSSANVPAQLSSTPHENAEQSQFRLWTSVASPGTQAFRARVMILRNKANFYASTRNKDTSIRCDDVFFGRTQFPAQDDGESADDVDSAVLGSAIPQFIVFLRRFFKRRALSAWQCLRFARFAGR